MRTRVGTLGRTGRPSRLLRAAVAALGVMSAVSVVAPSTATAAPVKGIESADGKFKVVEELPHYDGLTPAGTHGKDGWLVINPGTRRGYQIFRPNARDTVIASFDLDTYEFRRSVTLKDVAVAGNCPASTPCTAIGNPGAPGDVVHAVDKEGGRIYIGGVTMTPTVNGGSTDLVRALTVMEINEAAFDNPASTQGQFLRHIRVPATQAAELAGRDLYGMSFHRAGASGKLLLLFSTQPSNVSRQAHDHWLAQWDVSSGFGDWTYLLQACSRAVLVASPGWAYQLAILKGKEFIYVGCQASHGVALAVRVPIDASGRPGEVTAQQGFPLPATHANVLADPVSERLIFQTDVGGTSFWVFDGPNGSWVGSIASTLWTGYPVGAGIDPTTGRLYTLVPDHVNSSQKGVQGGFGYSDTRLTPAPQTKYVLPELDYPGQFLINVDPADPATGRDRRVFLRRGGILGLTPDFPGNQNDQPRPIENKILVIRDKEPIAVPPSFDDIDKLTVDRPEQEGVTEASFNGVARGFGTRVLLVGGATGAVPSRPLDEKQFVEGTPDAKLGGENIVPPLITSCYRNDREVAFGSSEAKVSDLVASAQSTALVADGNTQADLGQPGSRCPAPGSGLIPKNAEAVKRRVDNTTNLTTTTSTVPGATTTAPTTTTLPVSPPPIVELPNDAPQFLAQLLDSKAGQPWDRNGDGKDDYTSSCSGDQDPDGKQVTREGQQYNADVKCNDEGDEATARSTAALVPDPALPVRIADSSVETSVVLDPEDGIVSTVTSTVRGLEIAGAGRIGLIQAKAISYAHGRKGTAFTKFERKFCGIDLPTLQREACGDPSQVVRALNTAIGRYGEARLRAPDAQLQKGSPGGYQSAIQRDRRQAFTDRFVSRDTSNAVPALELIFYNDSQTRGAGRQIFGFAAVEASSTYGIKCLEGVRPDGKDCKNAPGNDPANLTLVLQDGFEKPLAGGVFKVHEDKDGDGAVGVNDPVMTNGTCMTAADGTGNCNWEGITPGDYVVEQTTAPAGYDAVDDFAVSLPSGNDMTVTFTNLRAVAGVLLGVVDSETGDPLAGAEFELHQDDGNGSVGGSDKLYATCKSDAKGLCLFELPAGSPAAAAAEDPKLPCFGQTAGKNEAKLEDDLKSALTGQLDGVLTDADATASICVAEVPLGTYVVHQKTAPADYDVAEDLPVKFDLPGQVALLVFSNGLTAIPGTEGSEAKPADPGEEPREIPPVENVVVEPGSANPQPIVQSTPIQGGGGGPLQRALNRIIAAPASAIRWLFSNPRELGLMVAVWTVIWLPCYLAERRRVLRSLRDPSTTSSPIGATVA